MFQPYRDLARGSNKEAVLAHNASWLFRAVPYLLFAATWVAAALVPTFGTGLIFSWSADLIVITALLGSARFFLALAGMDVGTSASAAIDRAGGDDLVAGRAGDDHDRLLLALVAHSTPAFHPSPR